MTRPRRNAKPDFDLTGDAGEVVTSAVSPRSPAQDENPSPWLHEHRPDETGSRQRSPREVLERHLWQSRNGSVEDDLAENYAPDAVVLSRWGVERGYEGMRRLAAKLERELPGLRFAYDEVLVEGDFGFLAWRGWGSNGAEVRDGADSYVIRDGRIVAQSVHYTVEGGDGDAWS